MVEFIALFFPTFITLNIIKKKNKMDYKELILKYPLYNLLINLFTFLLIIIYKFRSIVYLSDNFNIMSFCLKYLILASLIALLIPYLIEFIKKNFEINIKIRRDKKKNEKNN